MKNYESRIVQRLATFVGGLVPPSNDLGRLLDRLDAISQELNKRPPQPGESLAISWERPKTAALSFDRVLQTGYDIPIEVGYLDETGVTDSFIVVWLFSNLLRFGVEVGAAEGEMTVGEVVSESYVLDSGLPATICTSSAIPTSEAPSAAAIVTAALSNLQIVNEDMLTWDQVLEVRSDPEARTKYRRLSRWVTTQLAGRSSAEVEDDIAIKLEDYEWACKKHGLKTKLGTLSALLDPKFLTGLSAPTAAAGLIGGPGWASLTAASLVFGKVVASFGTSLLEFEKEKRGSNYEIAYIHEIKEQLGDR